MNKLKNMSKEELWQLFPIILDEHRVEYKYWYEEEKGNICEVIGSENIGRINHFGSSLVEGLVSKPTVDILLELNDGVNLDKVLRLLEDSGWIVMGESNTDSRRVRIYLNKGYTQEGFAKKVYHLHVCYMDDWDELYFRDYLLGHKEVVKAYSELKLSLLEEFRNNRDRYTEAKSEFIKKYTKLAREEYGGRYKIV